MEEHILLKINMSMRRSSVDSPCPEPTTLGSAMCDFGQMHASDVFRIANRYPVVDVGSSSYLRPWEGQRESSA